MSIKHAFESAKSDGGDTSLVRPSDWNADHVFAAGLTDTVFQIGAQVQTAPSSSEQLPANGGSVAVSLVVSAPFRYTTLSLRNLNTANLREAEHRLYIYNTDSSAMEFVTGTDGTYSFTPTVASDRSSTPSGSPVLLDPGVYWLVIRNTSATQVFTVGYTASSGTFWATNSNGYIKTIGSSLGSTLDLTGWSGVSRFYGVRLLAGAFGV